MSTNNTNNVAVAILLAMPWSFAKLVVKTMRALEASAVKLTVDGKLLSAVLGGKLGGAELKVMLTESYQTWSGVIHPDRVRFAMKVSKPEEGRLVLRSKGSKLVLGPIGQGVETDSLSEKVEALECKAEVASDVNIVDLAATLQYAEIPSARVGAIFVGADGSAGHSGDALFVGGVKLPLPEPKAMPLGMVQAAIEAIECFFGNVAPNDMATFARTAKLSFGGEKFAIEVQGGAMGAARIVAPMVKDAGPAPSINGVRALAAANRTSVLALTDAGAAYLPWALRKIAKQAQELKSKDDFRLSLKDGKLVLAGQVIPTEMVLPGLADDGSKVNTLAELYEVVGENLEVTVNARKLAKLVEGFEHDVDVSLSFDGSSGMVSAYLPFKAGRDEVLKRHVAYREGYLAPQKGTKAAFAWTPEQPKLHSEMAKAAKPAPQAAVTAPTSITKAATVAAPAPEVKAAAPVTPEAKPEQPKAAAPKLSRKQAKAAKVGQADLLAPKAS